jgi:hypothetical protein
MTTRADPSLALSGSLIAAGLVPPGLPDAGRTAEVVLNHPGVSW